MRVCLKKTQQKSLGLQTEPKNSLDQNLTRKNLKSRAEPQKFLGIKWYNYHESSDCFEYPKKSLRKSSCPPKILAKIFLPKQLRNRRLQTQKDPLIIPVTWNPERTPRSPNPPPWGLERASQHLRICNCLLNVLESNFKAPEKLTGRDKGKGGGGPFSPQFPPVLCSCLRFLDYLETWNRLHN